MSEAITNCDGGLDAGKNQNENISTDGSTAEVLPHMCKLNCHCFEHLFEWLSLSDLKNLRQTGKRIKQVVNDYFKLNYSLDIRVQKSRLEQLNYTRTIGFEFINRMVFLGEGLDVTQFEGMSQILNHIESIEFICPFVNGDFYEDFLKHRTRLKHLMIRNFRAESAVIIGNGNDWLSQCYPTLEHIGFDYTNRFFVRTELITFFEQNLNVRIFSIGFDFVWKNQEWMLQSNIKIEQLDIFNYYVSYRHNENNFELVCDLLNKLHQRGLYQRLHLYIDQCEQEVVTQITPLNALERLALDYFDIDWSFLPPLTSLREFFFYRPDSKVPDVPMKCLMNVRRIDIFEGSIDMTLPFIRSCSKLEQIRIKRLRNGTYSKDGIINLVALNNERTKLSNAHKITIFVREDVFLKNKWQQAINFSLIALKRNVSWDKNYLFHEW